MGVISNGNAESEIIPELQIVDEATFQRAQELMENGQHTMRIRR